MIKSAITTENLAVQYQDVLALQNVNVVIPQGTRTAILGPNGAGKSTFVKSVLGLEKKSAGTVSILDQTEQLPKLIQDKVAYIPQRSTVNSQFPTTVFDIVLMGRYAYINHFLKRPSKKDKEIALAAIEKMKLSDLKDRHITALSGGQQQRVFIARALAQQAELYIMDEPLAGVDIKTEQIIMDTLKEFQEQEKTTIVIHHDLQTVKQYFDFVVWVNKTVHQYGPVDKVFTDEWYHRTYQQSNQELSLFN